MWLQPSRAHNAYVLDSHQVFVRSPTEHQHDNFGASPSELAGFAISTDLYISALHTEIYELRPSDLRGIFEDPELHPASHFIVTLHPSPEDRSKCTFAPASQHVFRLLLKKLFQL